MQYQHQLRGDERDTKKKKRADAFAATDASERSLVSPMAFRRPVNRVIHWSVFIVLVILTLPALGPIYWMFSGALKSSIEIFQTPPTFWPQNPQWGNYTSAWDVLSLPLYFVNTLILAIGAVILQLLISTTAAYALSKLRPAWSNIIQACFFATLMVPPVVYMIPQFINISELPIVHVSLFNNWSGVWLPEAASAFNILILKIFFDSIPSELTEAARLDGANAIQLLTRIILPLSQPALAVVTIFTIIASWKDFLWPLLVLADSSLQPLMVALFYQSSAAAAVPFSYLIAGFVLASLPPIILFLVFQKQIIRGVNLTGLKG